MSLIIPDQKVYTAAKSFSKGASNDELTEILSECLSDDIIKRVLQKLEVTNAYKDDDYGYSAFFEAVNDELGENVYSAE